MVGQRLQQKAVTTLLEAEDLFDHDKFNGAASRAYYAAYLAVIGKFELDGLEPPNYDGKTKWPHPYVANNAGLAELERREKGVLAAAYELRITADYKPDNVKKGFVVNIIPEVRKILEVMGILGT